MQASKLKQLFAWLAGFAVLCVTSQALLLLQLPVGLQVQRQWHRYCVCGVNSMRLQLHTQYNLALQQTEMWDMADTETNFSGLLLLLLLL
jgi:hypothetical protein